MAKAAEQLRRLAPLIWLSALPVLAQAQAEPRPNGSAPDAGTTSAPGEGTTDSQARRAWLAAEHAPTVLFLVPADVGESQALRDALLAQFSLLDAQLVFEPDNAEGSGSLSSRLSLAQELAARRNAVAVFWIDAPADGRWLLHMMDAQNERVIVRAINAAGDRRSAAIEAVAVMTRSSTRALVEDEPEPPAANTHGASRAQPASTREGSVAQASSAPTAADVGTAPNAPTDSASSPASAPPDGFRLSLGYTGDYFAKQVDWQHGFAIGVAFMRFRPWYASISVALTPAIEVTGEATTFSLRRLPFAGRFGYRLVDGRIALDAELGLLLEWLHRPPSTARELQGATVTTRRRSTDGLLSAATPRVRAELRILPAVGVYVGGGLDILLNDFAYVSGGDRPQQLIYPNRVRPVAELGISFYP